MKFTEQQTIKVEIPKVPNNIVSQISGSVIAGLILAIILKFVVKGKDNDKRKSNV